MRDYRAVKFQSFIVPGGEKSPPAIAPGVAVRATMETVMINTQSPAHLYACLQGYISKTSYEDLPEYMKVHWDQLWEASQRIFEESRRAQFLNGGISAEGLAILGKITASQELSTSRLAAISEQLDAAGKLLESWRIIGELRRKVGAQKTTIARLKKINARLDDQIDKFVSANSNG